MRPRFVLINARAAALAFATIAALVVVVALLGRTLGEWL